MESTDKYIDNLSNIHPYMIDINMLLYYKQYNIYYIDNKFHSVKNMCQYISSSFHFVIHPNSLKEELRMYHNLHNILKHIEYNLNRYKQYSFIFVCSIFLIEAHNLLHIEHIGVECQ